MSEDLTTLIEDSITDATLPSDPIETSEPTPEPVELAPTEEVAPTDAPDEPAVPETPVQDEFDKRFGLTAQSSSGRENRIPYSRVKKITEKAINDAKTEWTKSQAASFVPTTKFTELETKAKDYESRLGQVAEFEKVMVNEPLRFLQMLYKQPGYAQILDQLAQQPATAQPTTPEALVPDDMPEPDQALSDGSKVYSLEGLKGLLAWQDQKTAKRTIDQVMKQVEARYAPLENSYQSFQKKQQVMPLVEKQIADARTWPLFNENEDEIVKALQSDSKATLEMAYRSVVFPKMTADRERLTTEAKVNKDTLRAEILKELKQAPRATSAIAGATRPAAVSATGGARSLEDVIQESLKSIK